MNKLLDYLTASIQEIETKLEAIKENGEYEKYNVIISKLNNSLSSIQNSFTEAELTNLKEVFDEIINNNDFSETESKRADFIVRKLIPGNRKLDSEQVKVCDKIKNLLEEKVEELSGTKEQEIIEENRKLLSELCGDSAFSDFDLLKDKMTESGFDYLDQIKILKDIINKNYDTLTIEESEEMIIYNNSEDDLRDILNRYGYNYDNLNQKNKEYLIKYANLDNMTRVLETSYRNDLTIFGEKGKSERVFVMILVNSSEDMINDMINTCKGYGLNFREFINKNRTILYESKSLSKGKSSGHSSTNKDENYVKGDYREFKGTAAFLKSKNINIREIEKKCPSILHKNPETLKLNWHTLENLYQIDINKDALTGLTNGTGILVLDKYIEILEKGYEYVSENQSKMCNYTIRDLINYKNASVNGNNLFYYTTTDKLFMRKTTPGDFLPAHDIVELELSDNKKEMYDALVIDLIEKVAQRVIDNEYVKLLEENYKENNIIYNIDGTRISRQKVLRVLTNFVNNGIEIGEDEIKYALAYQSILIDTDLDNINNFQQVDKKALY